MMPRFISFLTVMLCIGLATPAQAFHQALMDSPLYGFQSPASTPSTAAAVTPPASGSGSGNLSNDKLLTMPEYGQAAMLSKALHYGCLGKNPYYMGTQRDGANRGVSFWSITCGNGGDQFMVAIAPDDVGSTKVFSCNLLHGDPWKCYEKLKAQR